MPRKDIPSNDPDKIEFWRTKIEEQLASGLTQAEFCRQKNLGANTFSFWKNHLFPEQKLTAQKLRRRRRTRIKVTSPYERDRLVKKWSKSGLTQAEFCRRENILEWQLSDWKSRMDAREKAEREQQKSFVEVSLSKNSKLATATIGQAPRVIAEIQFEGGSISIFSNSVQTDIKNILLALMECSDDRSK